MEKIILGWWVEEKYTFYYIFCSIFVGSFCVLFAFSPAPNYQWNRLQCHFLAIVANHNQDKSQIWNDLAALTSIPYDLNWFIFYMQCLHHYMQW